MEDVYRLLENGFRVKELRITYEAAMFTGGLGDTLIKLVEVETYGGKRYDWVPVIQWATIR